MKEWNQTSVNVKVVINDDTTYHINHTITLNNCKVVTNYYTIINNTTNSVYEYKKGEEEEEEGFKLTTVFDSNGNIIGYNMYENGHKHTIMTGCVNNKCIHCNLISYEINIITLIITNKLHYMKHM